MPVTDLLGELVRREIRCIDPLRLLAAYPTRRQGAAAGPVDLEALVDATELPWLNKLDTQARGELLAREISLIYDVAESADLGLAAARTQLERLGTAIVQDPLLARAEVYLLEYPDPTGDATGATAKAVLNELVPGVQVNRRELDLVRERLLRPLNESLHHLADREGWSLSAGSLSRSVPTAMRHRRPGS